jgi:CRISPR/Cas system-associated exonuclease Cas4 (RecB family)
MPFGMDGAAPLVVQLPSGRELRFRGKVDRVDAGAGHHVVLDYKTGKGLKYKKLEGEGDAVLAGTALQLGLYAEAVRARLGGGDVEAYYWLATSDGDFARRGYPWTGERRERFLQVLETIVDGVEAGTFPGVPGQYDSFVRSHDNCSRCAFDDLCPRDRDDHAEAKVAAPELAVLAHLLPPEPPDPDPGATAAPGSAPA